VADILGFAKNMEKLIGSHQKKPSISATAKMKN